MTKENLVTSHIGTTLAEAKTILMKNKIEKLYNQYKEDLRDILKQLCNY